MLIKPTPSTTTLYSSENELESHVVRFIMAEKNIERDVNNVLFNQIPDEIIELNPCQSLPTLFDRGLVLYDLSVIIEYLDERFPFPPLLPVDPIDKAEKRLLIYRFTRAEGSWFELVNTIQTGKNKAANEARKILASSLIDLIPLFAYQPFFKSESMSIVDACLAPILWRLKKLKIDLGPKAKPIHDYAKRLFSRDSFKSCLSDFEKELNS